MNSNAKPIHIPDYLTDDSLELFIRYLNTYYFNLIEKYNKSNYRKFSKKIQQLSESILDKINIIIYCHNKDDSLLNTILIIYNQSYKLFLDKKHSFNSIAK